VALFDWLRQRRSERASYEAFLRWQEGAAPRDDAEAQEFEELDAQYSWQELPEHEPEPPPGEAAEWSKPHLGAHSRDATYALFYAGGELGEATSAFDQVREAAQSERAAQQARDHEQAGDPHASRDGTARAESEADKEAGS
jgi:hypothetical protein